MNLIDFRRMVEAEARTPITIELDGLFEERVHGAVINVASQTIPQRLVTTDKRNELFRDLGLGEYLRKPIKATIAEDNDIDIDGDLLRCVALYTCATYLPRLANTLLGIFYSELSLYDMRLGENIFRLEVRETDDF